MRIKNHVAVYQRHSIYTEPASLYNLPEIFYKQSKSKYQGLTDEPNNSERVNMFCISLIAFLFGFIACFLIMILVVETNYWSLLAIFYTK